MTVAPPKLRLAIGVPAYGGGVVAYQAQMWISFGRALAVFDQRFELVMGLFVDINGVQRARNRLLAEAMHANADWLLMIDSDTWAEASRDGDSPHAAGLALLRMISDADEAKIAVVSAPVRKRAAIEEDRPLFAAFKRREDGSAKQLVRDEILRGLQDVDEVGGACLAVNLHAVLSANASFEFTPALSEDREFCRQIRAAGFRIALDGRVRTGHLSRPFPLYSE